MTSSAIEFANQLADVRNKLKVKNDAFIAKYLPIIKQGILDAAGSNDSCYEFKIHEHEPDPKYFNHFKEYKKHYNPAQYYDAMKEIAKLLGVADPDIARDIELKLDCPEDNHENFKSNVKERLFNQGYLTIMSVGDNFIDILEIKNIIQIRNN